MTKSFLLALVLAVTLITSCTKDEIEDYTKTENISGTTWKFSNDIKLDDDLEYALLIFTSTSIVEGWSKQVYAEEEIKDWTGSFKISNDSILISYNDNLGEEKLSGIIEGTDMSFINGEMTLVFSKE